MAKNAKEVAVKKEVAETKAAGVPAEPAPSRLLSPFRAWERELDRMFGEFPFMRWPALRELEARFPRELRLQAPTVDVYEEKNEVVVKAEVPGMSKDDLDVTLSDSTLTLKGEKKKEEEVKEKDYYRCEREYGSFVRSIPLPVEVKRDGAKAVFKNGVLEIRLPKSETAQKKAMQVPIRTS